MFCLFTLLGVVVLVIMLVCVMPPVLLMAVDPDSFALSPSRLLFFDTRAEPPPVLLIPGAQRLSAKHEIVILNGGGHHPRMAGQVDRVGGRVRYAEVGDQHARLRRGGWALRRRHIESET